MLPVAVPETTACKDTIVKGTSPELGLADKETLRVRAGSGFTVIVSVSEEVSAESVASSLSMYVPDDEKVAVVVSEVASANVTVPAPLCLLHVVVVAGGSGRPSSVALPCKVTWLAGSVIVWFAPAFTTGGLLGSPPPKRASGVMAWLPAWSFTLIWKWTSSADRGSR